MSATDTMHGTTDASTAERGETDGSPRDREIPERGEFVSQVADAIGRTASVETAFGAPVRHEGVTIIPVARIAWGFGGGSGPLRPAGGDGRETTSRISGMRGGRFWGPMQRRPGGGGGGARVQPIGYIVVREGDAVFRPIRWVPSLAIGMIGFLLGARLARSRQRVRR